MTKIRNFKLMHASHAVSDDDSDIHVEFINQNEVAYRDGQRSLTISLEAYISSECVPDGSTLWFSNKQYWDDNSLISAPERDQIIADFTAAALPLLTKFYYK